MEKLAELIDLARKQAGLSYKELSERVKVSGVYISQFLRGMRIPKDDILVKIAEALALDPEFILRLAHYEKAPESARQYLSLSKNLSSDSEKFDNIGPWSLGAGKRIPILGWVQAGIFAPSESPDLSPLSPEDYVYSDIKGRNLFALRVENDSMEPIFHPGDIIIINPNIEPKTGDYVIVRLPEKGEVTFKKLILKDKLLILRPLNPKYEDIILEPKEKFEIVGKVVERKTIF